MTPDIPLAVREQERQGIYEKDTQDLIRTAKQQLFGEELPRQGKLVLSQKVMLVKMREWGISKETLELTFEYGEKTYVKNGIYQIVRKYKYYSVGLWYVEEYRPVKQFEKC